MTDREVVLVVPSGGEGALLAEGVEAATTGYAERSLAEVMRAAGSSSLASVLHAPHHAMSVHDAKITRVADGLALLGGLDDIGMETCRLENRLTQHLVEISVFRSHKSHLPPRIDAHPCL